LICGADSKNDKGQKRKPGENKEVDNLEGRIYSELCSFEFVCIYSDLPVQTVLQDHPYLYLPPPTPSFKTQVDPVCTPVRSAFQSKYLI
jgi:hypothetical protein